MPSGDALLTLRPVFIGWNVLATRLWMWGYFASMCGVAGTIVTSLVYRTDGGVPAFITFTALGAVIAPFAIYPAARLNYARTVYEIHPDRIELSQGFFVAKKKIIMFRDVLEVTLQQGVVQRACGLGTINLSTQASDTDEPGPAARFGFTAGSKSGANLQDVAKPQQTFDTLKAIVDRCRGSGTRDG